MLPASRARASDAGGSPGDGKNMNESVLSIAALFLLGWVIYLKYEIGLLRAEIEQLTGKLKKLVHVVGKDVETGNDKAVWGQKPPWVK